MNLLSSMQKRKVVLVILLLVILIFLLFYSYLEFNKNDYPDSGYLFAHYQTFNNTEITFPARIRDIDTANQTLTANIGDPPYTLIEINISTIKNTLHRGDSIFVIGILTGNRTVSAERIFVRDPGLDYFIFISSIPAIPYVLFLFFRTWCFDRKSFTFIQRKKNA